MNDDGMKLGQIINKLQHLKADKHIYFDFGRMVPRGVSSSRGHYEDVAIGYDAISEADDTRVGTLLESLVAAVGVTYSGYKGGEYKATENSTVWVDNYSEWSGTVIEDIVDCGWCVIIKTYSEDLREAAK